MAGAKLLTWLFVSGVPVGALVGVIHGTNLGSEYVAVAIVKGCVLGALISVTLGGLEQIALRQWWRRLALGVAILVRVALYTPLTLGIFVAVSAAFDPWVPWSLARTMVLPAVWISFACLLAVSAVLALARLLGPRVLLNLISGRYHRPFEEERIFLFLDLVGSTAIAERIGPVRYHAFLRDFIEGMEDPVLGLAGDVYQYVGDEVVVTWPLADRRANARCLACHFAIADAIDRLRRRYVDRYGAVPTFRTGIHVGRVVAGEIGDRRRQVVFVGDVVNTASRAQAEAKARNMEVVVTGELIRQVELPPGYEARPLGAVVPKGKEQPVDLFEIARGSEGAEHKPSTFTCEAS